MRIAVVHDWLYVYGGAERVLKAIIECFPEDKIDVHCLFDVLSPEDRKTIGFDTPITSFLQRAPWINTKHRLYLPLMPFAVEQLDFSGYDLVISSSYCVAKAVITGPDQLHISYIHSPMRYAWDLQHQYLRESNKDKGLSGLIARIILFRMRIWDVRTSHGPNYMITNSNFVARRVHKIYGRCAEVIHPPVDVFPVPPKTIKLKKDYFFTASRLVPYKNVHHIVEAFKLLPNEKLIVAGNGPELVRLKAIAGSNVEFVGFVSNEELKEKMQHAKAFVFAAEEDFGIVPLEAQSQGTPVIAYGKGGILETIITSEISPTGLFFFELTPASIAEAVVKFLSAEQQYDPYACYNNALRSSEDRFKKQFAAYVKSKQETFKHKVKSTYAQPLNKSK